MYHDNLKHLADILENIDSDPQKSMLFYTTSLPSTTIKNKPPDNVRWHLLVNTLYHIESKTNSTEQQYEYNIQYNVDELLEKLNNQYQTHQHLCWQSHSHHFHKTVDEY